MRIDQGSVIQAGDDVSVAALGQNDLTVTTFVPATGESTNVSFSFGIAHSTAKVAIRGGAVVEGNDVSVEARNRNAFRNSAIAAGFGAKSGGDSAAGIAVALGFYQSDAAANVEGTVDATGDVRVTSRSINTVNATRSFGSVSNAISVGGQGGSSGLAGTFGSLFGQVGQFIDAIPLGTKIGGRDDLNMQFRSDSVASGYAAGIAMVTSDNRATALLGDGARVFAGHDLQVLAEAEDPFQVSASGSAGTLGQSKDTSIGGALAYSKAANQASAFIGWNAQADALGTMLVDAQARITSPVAPLALALTVAGLGPQTEAQAIGAVHAYGSGLSDDIRDALNRELPGYLNDALDDEGRIGTSFIHAGGSVGSGGTLIGGGINVLYTYNAATSGIAKAARVNQRLPTLPAEQDVIVRSIATVASVNFAGNASVLNFVTSRDSTGIGGFFDWIVSQNFATAAIDDLATVSAGRDILVSADTAHDVTTIVEAGDAAESTAVDGAIAYVKVEDTAWAYAENRANLRAARDLALDAESAVRAIDIAPAIAIGDEFGAGIAAVFTEMSGTTRAFMADAAEKVSAGGYGGVLGAAQAGRDMRVKASASPALWSVAASAGIAAGSDQGSGPVQEASVEAGEAQVGGTYGFGASGSVAFNWFDQDTQAYIRDAVTITVGGALALEASSKPLLVAAAGAFAFGNDVGIGGTYAHNEVDQTTSAFAENARLSSKTVHIAAQTDAVVVTVAASGSGAKESGSIAGAVPRVIVKGETLASIGGAALVQASDVFVGAEQNDQFVTVAGAATIGPDFAVGASVGLTSTDSAVRASIEGAVVHATGSVEIDSEHTTEVIALAAALGVATSGIGAGGSGLLNTIGNAVDARVGMQAQIVAGSALRVAARDRSTLLAVAGSGAAADDVAIGAAVADNEVGNDVNARVDQANAEVGSLDVEAIGHADIAAITVGGAGAQTFAIEGSFARNTIENLAGASITGGARIAAAGDVQLTADDRATISALSGSLAGAGTAAVGLAWGTNVVGSSASASIEHSSVASGGAVGLSATSTPSIKALTVAGAGAGTVAAGGSVSLNQIHGGAQSTISDGAEVHAARGIDITAQDHGKVQALAGGVAGAGTAAVGVAVGTNEIQSVVRAEIDASRVTAASVALSADSAPTIEALTVGGAGAGTFATGGSVSLNNIHTTSEALIVSGSQVEASGPVGLTASDGASIEALAGGVAGAGAAAIGAAYATNQIGGTSAARISASTVRSSASGLDVSTVSRAQIKALTVGGAGAGAFAAGGSVSRNSIKNTVAAQVEDAATASARGPIAIEALDKAVIESLAGGVAGAGLAAIGVAKAANAIEDSTTASIAGSTVESAAGDVELNATAEGTIEVIAVGGAGAGAFAAAGSLSENDIANTAAARIVAGSSVDAGGNLSLNASDDALIKSLAGGVAGAGLAAIGAAQSTNRIASTIETAIDASVARAGTMALEATTDADIRVASLGGAGAGIAAIAGSDSHNDIRNSIDAHLSGGAQALARGALTVHAADDAAIAALAGGGAGAVVIAVGAGRAENAISNTVTAYSEHATIDAQSIDFFASTTPEIGAIAAGGSGALYFAFGGSIADNRIGNRLDAHVAGDSVLTATQGDVSVRAMEIDASIRSLSGTVTGAGGLSVGAAFSTNNIGSTLTAYIESARAAATLGSVQVTVDSHASIEALTVGGFGAFLVAGGASVSRNAIHNTLDAHIADSATIQAQGAITIGATDMATIASLGGAVVGAGGVAIGGSTGKNEIGGAIKAFIDGANVQSTAGGILVEARGESTIKSLTVSGMGAALVAGGGSLSHNEITRAVDAHISGGAQVHAQRLVQVSAFDAPSIQTFAGAGAGAAGVAVGVSLSENAIGGSVTGRIADATVSSELGNVEVLGTTDTALETLTVAGAFAAVAVEASREDTKINPHIDAEISDGATVQAGADIAVRGDARFDVQGNAGGGAIGIAGIGDTKIAVSLDPRTTATVNANATLAAGHDIEIAASSTIERLEAGVYAGSGGVAAREAAVADALSTNSATAAISGADIERAAALRVTARTLSDIHANALGAALGAVAVGSTRAHAAETGTTLASIDQARIGQSPNAQDRVGALAVTATSTNTIAAEETMARGGVGLPNARNVATAQANPIVTSAIAGSTIAVQGDASIGAQSESSADADSFALDIGVLTVGGSDARAEVNPAVSAGIDDRTTLNAGGMVTVEALNNPAGGRAKARAQAPGGSLIAVNGADAKATAAANVDAHVRNADVHAGGLLTIRARSLDHSLAVGEGITLGLLAGVGQVTTRAFAGIDDAGSRSAIEADLDHARVTAAGLGIEATSADAAEVRGSASGGGVLSDQGAASTAHVGPQVRAAIGDDTSVDVDQDVAIAAVALPEADGGANGTTLGLFAVGDSVTQLLVDPVVNSVIGRNTQISAGRDVLIAASSGRAPAPPADTFEGASTAAGGDVDLVNDTIRLPGHGLSDGDEVFYQALGPNVVGGLEQARDYSALRVDDNTLQLGQNFDAAQVDAAQNLVRFTTPHRFADGDIVVYQARGGVPIGGAGSDGRRFKVEVVDDLTIKLQRADAPDRQTFDPSAAGTVDSAANTIAIADHGFRDGDAVIYRAPNEAGFTSAVVDVRVVTAGPDRGKPVQNAGDETIQDFPDNDNIYVPGSRIDASGQLVGHDFTAGEQVVYQASGPKQVVRFAAAHGLQTGDAVVYRNGGGGSAIGGLQDGATYFVIRVDEHALKLASSALAAAKGAAINLDPAGAAARHTLSAGTATLGFAPADVDVAVIGGLQNGGTYFVITSAVKPELSPFEIQLARTLAEAIGDPGAPGDPSDDVAVTPIALSPGKDASADRSVAHRLIRPSIPALGPLQDGATYFVRDATASSFRLAASPGGPALDIEQGAARGQHSLAMAGVDLQATSGIHRLVIDLSAAAAGPHQILGPGGMPLHASSTVAGDGVSSASASGSAGGFVGLKGAETSVTLKPVVAAFVEDQAIGQSSSIHAGRDVTVRSDSNANLAAGSRSSSGGLLASGRSESSASLDTSSSVSVGDRVTIDAAHDVLVSSSSAHSSRASGSARGGALVDLAESAPSAAVDYETQARVGHSAQIMAGNGLTVQALTSVDASAVSRARGAGLVARAKANASLVVGETRAITRTAIESDALLHADQLAVTAAMPEYHVSVDTDSRVRAIIFSDSDAGSRIAAAGSTELNIGAGAALTGEHGVAIVAQITNLDAFAHARARATALAGDTDALAINSVPVAARIVAEPGALVTAGPRLEGSTVHDALLVRADVETDRYVRTAERHGALIDFGERRQAGDLAPARSILWDADVVIHSGPSPELLVSADGTIEKAVNVTVDGGLGAGDRVSGPFRVDPIVNRIHGTARFDATESPGTDGAVSGVPGSIAGVQGTLQFQDTLKAITLHNLSPHLMTVGPIATLHDPSLPGAVLPAIVTTADLVTLQFDVRHRIAPTAIDIQPSPLAPIAMAASLVRPAASRRDQPFI